MTGAEELLGGNIRLDRPDATTAMVTLNRPAKKNALRLAMWEALAELFEGFAEERELRAVILTGAGGAFTAGADISEFATIRATPTQAEHYAATVDRCQLAIASAPKATIAAVSGPAYGGGCGLALGCDFRIADRTAAFAIPAARLGIVYGVEETRALLLAVGHTAAKEILFTGRRIEAEEAKALGLASHLVADDALGAARALAASLAGSAPLSIAGAKAVLDVLTHGPSEKRLARAEALERQATASEDYREGARAFAEKRAPRFTGR